MRELALELKDVYATLQRTGQFKISQEMYNRISEAYKKENGKALPACRTCLMDYVKKIVREHGN
jgi:hypothetical protein